MTNANRHRATRPATEPRPVLHGELTPRSAWRFLAGSFAMTWGLGVLVVAFLDQIEVVFGPMGYTNPVFILMVYSPGFVGVFMVWRHYGARSLVAFVRRTHAVADEHRLLAIPRPGYAHGVLPEQC